MSDADAVSKLSEDWPARAAETVVGYVDTVRKATTGKALLASRFLVYGLVLLLFAPILLVLLLILLVRGLTSAFAWAPFFSFESGEVWPAYMLLGFIFFVVGAFLWRKKGR